MKQVNLLFPFILLCLVFLLSFIYFQTKVHENADKIDRIARKCATAIVKESDVAAIVQDNQDLQLAMRSLAEYKRTAVGLQTRMERVEQDFETTRQTLTKNVALKSNLAKRQKSDSLELKSNVDTVSTRLDALEKKFVDLEYTAKDKIDILDKDLQILRKNKPAVNPTPVNTLAGNEVENVPENLPKPKVKKTVGRKKLLSSLSDDLDFNFAEDLQKKRIPQFDDV